MDSIVYVYFKDGKIKTLDIGHGKHDHEKMFNNGWKHTATVNASVFIERMFNEVSDSELRKSIQSLGPLPAQNIYESRNI